MLLCCCENNSKLDAVILMIKISHHRVFVFFSDNGELLIFSTHQLNTKVEFNHVSQNKKAITHPILQKKTEKNNITPSFQ